MITKSLEDFDKEKEVFLEKLNNSSTEEEKIKIEREYLNILKLYLHSSNRLINETFNIEITPFKSIEGYDALYKSGASNIIKKNKEEFDNEINSIITSDIYNFLNQEKKALIDNAFYIIKTYYKDSSN